MNRYEELCSESNLHRAFKRAQKGKTGKADVLKFEQKLRENLLQLRNELLLQTYHPQPLKTFILRDPKTRKISKSAFRDRVVHHALCNIIEPVFDRQFVGDSFANRLGKGTLNAVKRFDAFKRKVSQNNTITCFVLKADIKSYFDTVNHQILLKILEKIIKDEKVLWLIKQILANHHSTKKERGMPLGNLTSQFFANVYLNELDQFVKHQLKAKYYIRYVDDFVILHRSREVLAEYKEKIEQFLREKLYLRLHPDKSHILKLGEGVTFLGFCVFYHHRLLVKKNIRKFERKMENMRREYKERKIDREKVIEKFEGWLSYAFQANTYKYRRQLVKKFNQWFPPQPDSEIISAKKYVNFYQKIDESKKDFSTQKTLLLVKKGMTPQQIAVARGLKEGTIWAHLSMLVEHHQLPLKTILPYDKIKKILANIRTPNDTLKEIKERINVESISYNEINCVLANLRGKHQKKSIVYFINWYQRTNCIRKCYFNKKQRQECGRKFQQLAAKNAEICFTKKEFLYFFNNHVSICVLPEKEKKRFVSWREFKDAKRFSGRTVLL